MSKKKKGKPEIQAGLSESEKQEVSFFMDRLRMQDPQGVSLENCLKSLKQALVQREALAAALLEALSLEGGPVCFRAFCELQGIVRDKRLAKIVRRAAYRFRQKGLSVPSESAPAAESSPVVLIRAEPIKNEAYLAVNPKEHIFQYGAYVHSKDEDGYATVVLYVGELFSCQGLAVFSESRKGFKDFLRSGAEWLESRMHEIPPGHIGGVLQALASLGRIPSQEMRDFGKARRLLEPYRLKDPQPLFLQLRDQKRLGPIREPSPADLCQFLTERAGLIPFDGVFTNTAALQAVFTELETIQSGVIKVPDYIKQERVKDVLASATRRFLPAELCRALSKHWEELALWGLLDHEDPTDAEMIFALAEHAGGVEDPGLSPVMTRIVELSILITYDFATSALEADLRRLDRDQGNEPEAVQTAAGLYVPRQWVE